MVRIMAIEVTQSTRLVSVNIFRVLGHGRGRNKGFQDHGLKERDINHGIEMRQFRTGMGGVTDNVTQRTLDGMLWRPRGVEFVGAALSFNSPLRALPFLPKAVATGGFS